jgi:hypothetical protein
MSFQTSIIFLRPAAVPVIAIPLAFRRTASRVVEATNGPAVQSLTWTSPHHGSIFLLEKNRNRATDRTRAANLSLNPHFAGRKSLL